MVLVSNWVHDYKTCGCPNQTMIDGGYDYLRCGGKDLNKTQVLRLVKVGKRKKPKGFKSDAEASRWALDNIS